MGLVPFTYTHVEYDSGAGLLGPLACLASLAPVFFMVALASTLAQRRDLATAACVHARADRLCSRARSPRPLAATARASSCPPCAAFARASCSTSC